MSATRISANANHVSVPDVSLISPTLAGLCSWDVLDDPIGNDHLPILSDLKIFNSNNFRRLNARSKLKYYIFSKFGKDLFCNVVNDSSSVQSDI